MGKKATGLNVTGSNDATGAFLADLEVTIVEVARSGTTDIVGILLIERIKPGTYHVTCKKVGFADYGKIVEFTLGKMTALAVATMPV